MGSFTNRSEPTKNVLGDLEIAWSSLESHGLIYESLGWVQKSHGCAYKSQGSKTAYEVGSNVDDWSHKRICRSMVVMCKPIGSMCKSKADI